jgi:hypothetical protein
MGHKVMYNYQEPKWEAKSVCNIEDGPAAGRRFKEYIVIGFDEESINIITQCSSIQLIRGAIGLVEALSGILK